MLSLAELDPDTILPRHSHPHEQSTYVLEGELVFEIAGENAPDQGRRDSDHPGWRRTLCDGRAHGCKGS